MQVNLMNCERILIEEIADRNMKRYDVALTYALAIMSDEAARVDWAKVNAAIMNRWSKHALVYIKERAWKWVE